jgi:polyhydroxyalkanoate synthesis regulator phasin
MVELLKRSIYATIGIALMTREKVEEAGRRIASEAKLSESEGKQFVDELLKRVDETRASLEKVVAREVEATLKKLKIPTRTELDAFDLRLRALESAAGREK